MEREIEIEFKNLLTKAEFLKLKRHFQLLEQDFIKQVNFYFDTNSFDLKNNDSALRVRQKNGRYELTLKQPAEIGLFETNETITEQNFLHIKKTGQLPEGKVKYYFDKLKLNSELIYFGQLTTFRAETNYRDGLIAIDKSNYLNKTDYELEYEVTDVKLGKQHFEKLLQNLAIPKRQTDNKIMRFYNEKMNN